MATAVVSLPANLSSGECEQSCREGMFFGFHEHRHETLLLDIRNPPIAPLFLLLQIHKLGQQIFPVRQFAFSETLDPLIDAFNRNVADPLIRSHRPLESRIRQHLPYTVQRPKLRRQRSVGGNEFDKGLSGREPAVHIAPGFEVAEGAAVEEVADDIESVPEEEVSEGYILENSWAYISNQKTKSNLSPFCASLSSCFKSSSVY